MSWVKVSGFFIPVLRPLTSVLGFPGLFHVLVLGLQFPHFCFRRPFASLFGFRVSFRVLCLELRSRRRFYVLGILVLLGGRAPEF